MKFRLSLLLCFLFLSFFGQEKVFYFKDANKEYSSKTIGSANFKEVVDDIVLESKTDAVFWFKIPKSLDDDDYVFQIKSIDTKGAKGFQGNKVLEKLPYQRYNVFQFTRNEDTFIKIASNSKAYYPITLNKSDIFNFNEKKIITYNSFYYGFSFLVILYCFVYYFYFKDYAFLYYSVFLASITLGFLIIDGTLNLFGVSKKITNFLIITNYIALAFFASKFINSFLFLESIYPKLKKYTYTVGVLIILSGLIYFITDSHLYLLTLNILVFSLLLIYWLTSVLLFKRNIYTKILVLAFALLLFSAIDSFVLTNFGFRIFKSNPLLMKIGGIVQIIVLWFAVIFREKILRKENAFMKKEIISFSDSINLNDEKVKNENTLEDLSHREREIFNLIIQGKSNKMISAELNISVNTVKFHIKNIYEKLNIKSRKEALNIDLNIAKL